MNAEESSNSPAVPATTTRPDVKSDTFAVAATKPTPPDIFAPLFASIASLNVETPAVTTNPPELTVEFFKEFLEVEVGETTKDGMFTLLEGECFGACADAPVLLLNNHEMHSWMDEQKCKSLIKDLREERLVK